MNSMSIEKVLKSIAKIKKRKVKDAVYKLAEYCVDLEARIAVMEDQLCIAVTKVPLVDNAPNDTISDKAIVDA